MADALQEMTIFARVVGTGSLSAAARDLGLSPALVSRRLAGPGGAAGGAAHQPHHPQPAPDRRGRQPTTRPAPGCWPRSRKPTPRCPPGAPSRRASCAWPCPPRSATSTSRRWCRGFAARYPKVQLALSLSDRYVNVIEEGFDLAVRIAELEDSSLAARKLAPNRRVVCASPAYLRATARRARPRTWRSTTASPRSRLHDDLGLPRPGRQARLGARHRALCLRQLGGAARVGARRPGRRPQVDLGRAPPPRGRLARAPCFRAIPSPPTWRFRRSILTGATCPAKTRAFIDFLAESFGPEPYWDRLRGARRPSRESKPRAGCLNSP